MSSFVVLCSCIYTCVIEKDKALDLTCNPILLKLYIKLLMDLLHLLEEPFTVNHKN